MSQAKQLKLVNYIAILSIFLFAGAGSFMNAAVQTMMDAWPQLSPSTIRLVTALPSLVALPVTVWVGTVAGSKLTFRFCSILGTALILFGGIAPFVFSSNWTLILAFRALVGVGVGFIAIRNSLVLRAVPEEKQATIIGYGSAIFNAGGMMAGPIVGLLVTLGWRYAFLYDLLAAVPLVIMIFFLKEPEENGQAAAESKELKVDDKTEKTRMDWRLIAYVILQFVGTMALYPLLSGMSSYMASEKVGTAFIAGLAVSTYNVGGVLINMVMDPLVKRLNKAALPVLHLMFAAGIALVVFVPNLVGIFAGACICGMAFNALMSVYQIYNGRVGTPSQATFISTLLIAALGLGNFASVYYINACHAILHMSSDIKSTYFGTMIVYIALGIICAVIKCAPKNSRGNSEQ